MSRAIYNTMSRAHSPNFPSLLRHNSFSNPSVALPTSQIILATGFEVRWFKPCRVRLIFSERKNPEDDFLREESKAVGKAELILQHFRHFTYVTTHSPTFPSLHLRRNSFSNSSVTSPTSQFILQPFRRFTYVTADSPTLPLLHLRHSSFSNPFFASPTSQALHLIHLASRPCTTTKILSLHSAYMEFP